MENYIEEKLGEKLNKKESICEHVQGRIITITINIFY